MGAIISYSYALTNTGNVTLSAPFTVGDDKATVTCPPDPTSLAPGESITCTATYAITQADLDAGEVTNTAQGHAIFDGSPVDSNEDSETVTAVVGPAIEVTKSVWDGADWQDANSPTGPYLLGDPVFQFVVTNTGNVTLTTITLSDDPVITAFFADPELTTTCTIPSNLAPGATFTCYGTLLWVAGQQVDTATATGDYDSIIYDDTDTAYYFGAAPAIDIQKSPDTQTVDYDQTASFTIVVKNTGNVPLTDVEVTDLLAPDCDRSIGDLAVGAENTFTCSLVNVSSDFTNVAEVSGTFGVTPVSDEDDALVVVDILPDISVIKTATYNDVTPADVPETGGSVTFTFAVTNHSSEVFNLTSLVDDTFGDLDGQGTCDVPQTIAAGDTYTCATNWFLSSDRLIDHTNEVTASGTDEQENPDSATDDETVTFDDVLPTISVMKTAAPTSVPETGGDVTFIYRVTNNRLEDVIITDLTDDQFGTLVGDADCVVGTILAGGASCTFEATFTIPAGDVSGSHVNVFTATVEDNDENSASDSEDETVTYTDVSTALTVVKSTEYDSLPEPGGDFHYTATITNPSTLDVVTISAITDTYGVPVCSDALGEITLPYDLGPGASLTCAFTVPHLGNAGDAWTNTVDVTATDEDGVDVSATSNEVTVSLTDVSTALTVVKDTEYDSLPEPGGDFHYTATITNPSTLDVVTISAITDTYGVPVCSDALGEITLPYDLGPGASLTCAFTVPHLGNAGDAWTNTVDVTATDEDGIDVSATSNEVTVSLTDLAPDISVTKTADPASVPETGGDVTFTFLVENTGDEDVTLTSLTDSVFGDLNGQGDCVTGGTILAGGSYSCSITEFLSSDNLTSHYNVVTAVGTDDDGSTDEATDDETVTFTDVLPAIVVTKTAKSDKRAGVRRQRDVHLPGGEHRPRRT